MRHLDYILITRAGDGRWPRYQVKSLACPGCDILLFKKIQHGAWDGARTGCVPGRENPLYVHLRANWFFFFF